MESHNPIRLGHQGYGGYAVPAQYTMVSCQPLRAAGDSVITIVRGSQRLNVPTAWWKAIIPFFTAATSRALSLQQIQSLSQVLFASHRVPGAKFPTYQSRLQSAEPMNGQELLLQAGAKVGSAQRSRVFVLHLEWAMLKSPSQAVYQRSAFTTTGWRRCMVFSSHFALSCITRRMLKADSTKEHDAPLAPLAFASTCMLRPQLFAKLSKPLQSFCGHQPNLAKWQCVWNFPDATSEIKRLQRLLARSADFHECFQVAQSGLGCLGYLALLEPAEKNAGVAQGGNTELGICSLSSHSPQPVPCWKVVQLQAIRDIPSAG